MSDDRVLTADEADAILAKVESSTACISGQEIRALIATIRAAWNENAVLWERREPISKRMYGDVWSMRMHVRHLNGESESAEVTDVNRLVIALSVLQNTEVLVRRDSDTGEKGIYWFTDITGEILP